MTRRGLGSKIRAAFRQASWRNQRGGADRMVALEQELAASRAELAGASRSLATARALHAAMAARNTEISEQQSRRLAAAGHDLRQPLQTLALLHGLLAQTIAGEPARRLLARSEATLDAMSGMLNALLDAQQPAVGAVQPQTADAPG